MRCKGARASWRAGAAVPPSRGPPAAPSLQVVLGVAQDSNLGWSLADVEAAEAAEAAPPAAAAAVA